MSKICAIVSVHKFPYILLSARIANLTGQTIYKSGRLIIAIVSMDYHLTDLFPKDDPNLRIFLTHHRTGIYEAWNIAMRELAGVTYYTNANCDDWLEPDALERLVAAADQNKADIVYGDCFTVNQPCSPATSGTHIYKSPYLGGSLGLHTFSASELLLHYTLGNCPVWSRALVERVGEFDESYQLAGDYEFALRSCAKGAKFLYTGESVGTFYFGDSATTQNQAFSDYEARRAQIGWSNAIRRLHNP